MELKHRVYYTCTVYTSNLENGLRKKIAELRGRQTRVGKMPTWKEKSSGEFRLECLLRMGKFQKQATNLSLSGMKRVKILKDRKKEKHIRPTKADRPSIHF